MDYDSKMLFSRKQIEEMHKLFQENTKARYIWVRTENNLSGIGPDILVATVEDIQGDLLQEADITDPGTW